MHVAKQPAEQCSLGQQACGHGDLSFMLSAALVSHRQLPCVTRYADTSLILLYAEGSLGEAPQLYQQ